MTRARKADRRTAVPAILDRIAGGETLVSVAADMGIGRRTAYRWIEEADQRKELACARLAGADSLARQATEILDESPECYQTEFGSRIDPAYVQWQKHRAEQRMKLAQVFAPEVYGQKAQVEHTGKSGGPIENVTRVVLVDLVSEADAPTPA